MPSSPLRIHALADPVVNQIAAGEVIERPASVAKELLENSIDANALRIEIEVRRGGVDLFRIKDDGRGIVPADLGLALQRHATSKLRTLDDLPKIYSLGFRGEALSSIASVSHLALSSRVSGEEIGWRVNSQEPAGATREPVTHPIGTTVEVRDLFYNLPVRRKFLRSERTEFQHLLQVIRHGALSRFDIGFNLVHNQRQILRLNPANDDVARQRRVKDVCGAQFHGHSVLFDESVDGMRLWGWVGLPEGASRRSGTQYFYLNARPIRGKTISHAIRRAYLDRVREGWYPTYLLFLEIDPEQVDVNVHPTKCEVRFKSERMVHDFIYAALHRVLDGGIASANVPYPFTTPSTTSSRPFQLGKLDKQTSIGDAPARYRSDDQSGLTGCKPFDQPPLGQAIAVTKERYLISENSRGMVLVDIQRTRYWICYLRLKAMIEGQGITTKPLLIPVSLRVDEPVVSRLDGRLGALEKVGVEVDRASPRSVMVRCLPRCLDHVDVMALVSDLLTGLPECGEPESAKQIQGWLETMARHGSESAHGLSVRDDMNRWLREVEGLVADGLEIPKNCWRQLNLEDLSDLIASGGEPISGLEYETHRSRVTG